MLRSKLDFTKPPTTAGITGLEDVSGEIFFPVTVFMSEIFFPVTVFKITHINMGGSHMWTTGVCRFG